MKHKYIYLTTTLLLIFSALCHAEQRVFTQNVRYVMGENESRQELRELATLEARRLILEQVGIYIESTTELKQHISETENEFQDETEYQKEVIAITAGVTNTEIESEVWKEEAGVFVLYLTCKIKVDSEDVNNKITELVLDRQKLTDMKQVQEEMVRMQREIEDLRVQLEQANESNVEEIRVDRVQLSDELSAIEWFNRGMSVDDPDVAIKYHTFAIEQRPDFTEAYNYRGNAYMTIGDFDHAIVDFNRAIQIDQNYAKGYYNRGLAYDKKGDYDNAIDDYSRAIQINPKDAMAHNNRGIVYATKGDDDRAFDDYNRSIQIDPNQTFVYVNRGILFKNRGDYDRSITDCSHAIQIDPNFAGAYFHRGSAHLNKGEYDRAISDCNITIQIDPNFTDAYILRGNAYNSNGDYDLAIVDYNHAVQINPNYGLAFYNRGLVYTNKCEFDNAINDYDRAIQIDSSDAGAYFSRGWAYWYGLKDRINARRNFQMAKDLGYPGAQAELDKLR